MKFKAYSLKQLFYTIIPFFLLSCDSRHPAQNEEQASLNPELIDSSKKAAVQPNFSGQQMDVKTFEVIDSTTHKSLGWGYDIYIEGKKSIHQPIIPAVPGNNSFKTEALAKTVGIFAMNRMQLTGAFPTLTIQELDSLKATR